MRPGRLAASLVALACVLGGCMSSGEKKGIAEDGLPVWIDRPCDGEDPETICAVGSSDFAAADVEAAKADAETVAKNQVADQLQTRVTRLTERANTVMQELGGKPVGEKTFKDINRNFNEREIVGLRYVEYFYYPDRVSPEKVYVRAVLNQDSAKFSQDVIDAMAKAGAEELELSHEEAMLRLQAVREEYLAEQGR